MSTSIEPKNQQTAIQRQSPADISISIAQIKNGIWMIGIPSWLFGITDRGIAAFAHGAPSPAEVLQLMMASFFFLTWLSLKPKQEEGDGGAQAVQAASELSHSFENYLHRTQARMHEMRENHLISQGYILPYPYVCQIYHLLNLKHLESIHNFSLGNLKVIQVSDVEPTAIGGRVKFQTTLDSPMNALRIWRQPIVEVDLTLLTPYTVELSIPAYNGKRITVMFNVVPIDENNHKFLIDIYSDLKWPRPILQAVLHFSACLTLVEDLPYLQKLAERNLNRLLSTSNRSSEQDTMWLYKRFVELYGADMKSVEQLPAAEEAVS
ncbi:hypothetical protein [Leptolyngbya ohadii]|uniref:hypothetical protein n=1 Tax=Leptolyngbya ohadii TaxID=1962290 RepID=UPI000B59C0BB|nr:hypothetical protein [Leptolyngbya ohadii]